MPVPTITYYMYAIPLDSWGERTPIAVVHHSESNRYEELTLAVRDAVLKHTIIPDVSQLTPPEYPHKVDGVTFKMYDDLLVVLMRRG